MTNVQPAALLRPKPVVTDDPAAHIHGFPRGSITEIHGPASSGRTSLMVGALAEAAAAGEICALVDTDDAFDPVSGAAAGLPLDRLLWVRCGHNAEHALRVADLLVQSGGFGFLVFDLGDTPPRTANRISLTSWYRLRRAIEPTRTVMVVVSREPWARQAASLSLSLSREEVWWRGATPPHSCLLEAIATVMERRKPAGPATRELYPARALG